MSISTVSSSKEIIGHQKKSAETRKAKDPDAFRKMGRKGAVARHNKSATEESDIAKRAAAKRKERDPDTFRKMGRDGGKAPHVSRGRYRGEVTVVNPLSYHASPMSDSTSRSSAQQGSRSEPFRMIKNTKMYAKEEP